VTDRSEDYRRRREYFEWLVRKEGWERSHAEEELGLDRDGSRTNGKYNGNGYPHGERRGGRIVAEYIYKDQHGQNYLRVERTDDKQFPQSWWNPAVSCWVPGKPKGPKIPYRLPELLAAPVEEPVWACEGEKDADSVAALGLVATCHSEGAGKWTDDLNEWFAERVVYVVEDDDQPGRRCAKKRARQLSAVAAEVRIVSFAGVENVKDATEFLEAGHTKEELVALAEASPVFQQRVTIQVVPGSIADMIDDAMTALMVAEQPVFVRAGRLVEPIWTEYRTSKKDLKTRVTVLRPHTSETITYALNKHAAVFQRFSERKKSWTDVDPPPEVARMIVNLGRWPFQRIVGIINCPTLKPDGTILDQPGFDPDTQLWCEPDADICLPTLVERPTRGKADQALALLKDLLAGFPFVTGTHRSVALAAILTAVLRGAFEHAPVFLIVAPAAGTGKSFFADLVSTIIRARPCPAMPASDNNEEMEKRLGAILLESPPIVSVDNISFDLKSDLLCTMTTQSIVKPRILGKSSTPDCESRCLVFVTGNNVRVVGDLTRRTLRCALDAKAENPELREFAFDPVARVLANRSDYIAAAITIARAWAAAGEPDAGATPINGFEEWSRAVRLPLMWLGEADPVATQEELKEEDPERRSTRTLIELWREHFGTDIARRVRDVIDAAKETRPTNSFGPGPEWELVRPDLHEVLLSQAQGSRKGEIDPLRLGKWLQRIKGQVHGDYVIERAEHQDSHGTQWTLRGLQPN
jgi:putative DNA primase/helicase